MKLNMKSNALAILISLAMAFAMIAAMSVTAYGEEEESEEFSTIYGNGDPWTFFDLVHPHMIYTDSTSMEGIDLSPQGHSARIVRQDSSNDLLMITKVECKGYGDFSKLTSSHGTISIKKDEIDQEKSMATITGENGADLDVWNLKLGAAEDAAESIKITDIKIYYIQYKDYNLWIGDTQVNGRNLGDVLANDPVNRGKVSYVPSEDGNSGTLTLSGVAIKKCAEGKSSCISASDINLTIVLNGENKLGDEQVGTAVSVGGYHYRDLIIKGKGSLAVNGNTCGIYVLNALEISGVTVDAKGIHEGIHAGAGSLTISNSKVTASSHNHAIIGKVKNDVAGTGWADEDGTRGRAEIGISEEPQDLSGYKKVVFPSAPYNIAVFPAENGKVVSDKKAVYQGNPVTLTAISDKGYKLKNLSVAVPTKEIESTGDLVTIMGDAAFPGIRQDTSGTEDTECILKIHEDTFCIFDKSGALLDQLNVSEARFEPGSNGQYEASIERKFWKFTVQYGKLVSVSYSDKNTTYSYSFTGKSNGALPKEPVAVTTVKEGETYTFTMPAANVEVSAQFEPAPTSVTTVSGTQMARMTVKGKKSLTIGWNKINGAAGYDIFLARCSHGIKFKKVKTVKGNKKFKWTKNGLKKGTAYKAYVRAYVYKNGKKSYVRTSPTIKAYTGNGTKKFTNVKSVTIKNVKKGKLSLKKGKTFKIKAKVNKVNKNKKLMPKSYAPALRYMTTNKKVAIVSRSGKITAKGKGTGYIYVYAHNGVYKRIKVTVK